MKCLFEMIRQSWKVGRGGRTADGLCARAPEPATTFLRAVLLLLEFALVSTVSVPIWLVRSYKWSKWRLVSFASKFYRKVAVQWFVNGVRTATSWMFGVWSYPIPIGSTVPISVSGGVYQCLRENWAWKQKLPHERQWGRVACCGPSVTSWPRWIRTAVIVSGR